MNTPIPHSVALASSWFVENVGARVVALGEIRGFSAYAVIFPNDLDVGYPHVYLCDSSHEIADVIEGDDALDILDSFGFED